MAAVGSNNTPRFSSTSRRAFTNWLGNSALSWLSNVARSRTVPVVWSISLSTVVSAPDASLRFMSRSYASTASVCPARIFCSTVGN